MWSSKSRLAKELDDLESTVWATTWCNLYHCRKRQKEGIPELRGWSAPVATQPTKHAHPIIPDCHLQEHVQTPYRAPCTFHGLQPCLLFSLYPWHAVPWIPPHVPNLPPVWPFLQGQPLPSATWLLPTYALTLHMFCLLWKLSLIGLDPQNTLVVVVSQHLLHYM